LPNHVAKKESLWKKPQLGINKKKVNTLPPIFRMKQINFLQVHAQDFTDQFLSQITEIKKPSFSTKLLKKSEPFLIYFIVANTLPK
jgi:hypothetical protein